MTNFQERILVIGLLYFTSLHVAGQTVPDLSGLWVGTGTVAERTNQWPTNPAYTPEGAAAQEIAGTPEDPVYNCVIGFGRITSSGFPREILQEEDRITILYEYEHQVRRIFMDGRAHPERVRPTLMGHSIGRWEGSTLVVDTVGLKPHYFRNQGIPYSDATRINERFTPIDDGQRIEVQVTVEDPKYYTETWSVTRYLGREPGTEILEYDCTVRPSAALERQ